MRDFKLIQKIKIIKDTVYKFYTLCAIGFDLIKIGTKIAKNTSMAYLKYQIGSAFFQRTFGFLRGIAFGVFINHLTQGSPKETLYFYLVLLILVDLIQGILIEYLDAKTEYYARFSGDVIFETVLDKYKQIPVKYRNEPRFVEIERNLNIDQVSSFLGDFIRFFSAIYSIILAFFAISIIDFKLFFIAIFVGIVSFYLRNLSQFKMYESRDEKQYNIIYKNRNSDNFFYNNLESLSDNLKINNNFEFINKKFQKAKNDYYEFVKNYYQKNEKIRVYSEYLIEIAGAVTLFLVYYKGIEGNIAVGTLTILMSSYISFTSSISSLGIFTSSLLNKFLEIKSLKELLKYTYENKNLVEINSKKNFEIRFNNVSFKYPETENFALKNINLSIKKGDKLGIIGENGAGKSTLVKLLFRIYEPTEGTILLNGQNIYDIRDEDFYEIIKILSQTQLLEDTFTISELIQLGNTKIPYNEKNLIWSAKMSGAYEFINKFKNKFDQKIVYRMSTIFNKFSAEKFESLSPGQARRILISRIFYCKKPIVVLDEPTSNVDPLASKEVFENLNKLKNNEILILIAHDVLRLNNVVNKILVMKNGEVAEYGNREDLLADEKSIYSKTLKTYNSKNIIVEKE